MASRKDAVSNLRRNEGLRRLDLLHESTRICRAGFDYAVATQMSRWVNRVRSFALASRGNR